jgi:hypothetical protein
MPNLVLGRGKQLLEHPRLLSKDREVKLIKVKLQGQ